MLRLFTIAILAAALTGGCAFEPTSYDGVNADSGTDLDADFDADSTGMEDGGVLAPDTGESDMAVDPTDSGELDLGPDSGDAAVDMSPPPNLCDGELVDLQRSNLHCGSCGNACDPEFGQCRRGVCECLDPYNACGADNRCTDSSFDPSNCGVCGKECSTGQICDGGACVCLPGLTLCGGECVDLQNDGRHCGDCNVSCGNNACRDGMCRSNDRCGVLVFECRLDGGGTTCVNDSDSPLSCDASVLDECGTVCEGNEICYRETIVEPRNCRTYRPARGCTDCPCSDCSDNGEGCAELDAFPDKPVCLGPR